MRYSAKIGKNAFHVLFVDSFTLKRKKKNKKRNQQLKILRYHINEVHLGNEVFDDEEQVCPDF